MNTRISVVIPTYRRPRLLLKCLQALSEQTFTDFDVIIVSDGPDQLTRQIAVSWKYASPLSIEYLPLPVKKGPAAARNVGWKAASAPLIAFTDDDTLPDANWLQSLWDAWHGEELMVYTGKLVVPLSAKPTDYEWNTAQLEKAEFITANCACTKAALEEVGGFDEQFETAWREDSDLQFRLLQSHIPIQHLQEAVVVHPVRSASWGVSIKEQRKNVFNALLYKKFPDMYRSRIQRRPAWNYYIMIASLLLAVICLFSGQMIASVFLLCTWVLLTGAFVKRRLTNKAMTGSHIMEMIVTSIAIPFVAIYWSLYGALRYRVLYL
jgi:glycosyltransferase involved in cell wall biosynthesis